MELRGTTSSLGVDLTKNVHCPFDSYVPMGSIVVYITDLATLYLYFGLLVLSL